MNQKLSFFSIAIFSIFLGSQITEGVLLVPYWQSMPASEFYEYYDSFGPSIGRFYTILTIIAALIPISMSIYFYQKKSEGLKFIFISSFFAVLFVACFYIYFKGTNGLFYEAALDDTTLRKELVTWEIWHWGRIGLEVISLTFLILALNKET